MRQEQEAPAVSQIVMVVLVFPYQEAEGVVAASSLEAEGAAVASVCFVPEVASGPSLWHSPLLLSSKVWICSLTKSPPTESELK